MSKSYCAAKTRVSGKGYRITDDLGNVVAYVTFKNMAARIAKALNETR